MQIQDAEQPAGADDEAVGADAGGDNAADETVALEAEARKQGWVPRDEFEGNPKNWKPAEEYVRLDDPKYLRKTLRETQRTVEELRRAREQDKNEFSERLERFERMGKAQRAKLYQDIESARRQAVADGDTDRYDELSRQEAALYQQEQEAEKPAAKKEREADKPLPEVKAWVQANPWFTESKAFNKIAQGIHEQLLDDEPDLTTAQNLAKVRAEVIKRFPEKFGKAKPKTNGHTPVEGGQRMAAPKGGEGWADIPSDERKVIARHIEEGLYRDQADAAKAYWS